MSRRVSIGPSSRDVEGLKERQGQRQRERERDKDIDRVEERGIHTHKENQVKTSWVAQLESGVIRAPRSVTCCLGCEVVAVHSRS